MEVTWLGHSCFRLKGKEATVITDPCHPDYGYSLPKLQADIVTLSHSHPGHCYVEGIGGNPKIIKGPGEYEVKGVFITGAATFHDAERGEKRGKNTVYILEMDGITLCHLGDLGHLPAPELMAEMGDIQVLMLPVGGVSTFAVSVAVEFVKHITPRIALPMHYKTPKSTKELEPVDRFIKELGVKQVTSSVKLSVTRTNLPIDTQIVVLDYPQN